MEGFCSKEDSRKKDLVACLFEKQFQSANPLGRKTFFSKENVVSNRRTSFSLDESCDR